MRQSSLANYMPEDKPKKGSDKPSSDDSEPYMQLNASRTKSVRGVTSSESSDDDNDQ